MRKILILILILLNIQTKAQCWKTVAAGVSHTAAIKVDGTIWAWGNNGNGQIGDGTTTAKSMPTKIGIANDWKAVATGWGHTVALNTDGALWAWGYGSLGQIGNGSSTLKTYNPPQQVGTAKDWQTIATGLHYTMAIKTDGTLWAWGNNDNGQLGDGTITNKDIPTNIGTANDWKTISTGNEHSVALKKDGSLWAWGNNDYGQLGNGTVTSSNIPLQIGIATDWRIVTCGYSHTIAIKTDGTLWVWGDNANGQIGDGTTTNKTVPTQIGTANDWKTIAGGWDNTFAIKTDGSLWAWGNNGFGKLGNGTTVKSLVPLQIETTKNWLMIISGNNHTVAIKTDGDLWAWGLNTLGRLGDGTTVNKNIPTLINCPEAFTATTTQTNLNCTGYTNGSASISSVTGGTAPYTYLWSNEATKASISGLKAGDYSCTITDATSLSITKSFTITQPTTISFTTKNTNACNNNNGSLTVTATGGTAPYQYAISPDFVYQTSNVFSGLSAGNYTLIIKDANGCSTPNNSTSSITNTPPPTATAQSFNTGATVANLQASGSNIKWYNTITGGTALSTSTVLQTSKYYASQTVNGCESTRTVVDIIITSVPTSEQIPTYVSTNGLIAYFPFNGNADDTGPYNFKSITNNITPTTDRFQNNNNAYSFNGISSSIESNIFNYPQEIKSHTITGWFKANSPQLSKELDFSLLNFGNIYPNDWLKISFYLKGYLNVQIGSNTFQSQENYFNDKWTFFAITFDYNTNTFALYINNSYKLGGNISSNNTKITSALRIGKNQSNNNYFEGSIDDIGIWNRVLTTEEITNLYNSNNTYTYTLIPDINFEKKLITLGIDSGTTDGKVLTSSISSLTSLDVSFSLITNLTGIQDFTALKNLKCNDNKITSLDLSKNIALTSLDCSYNYGLTSLDLSKNITLTSLKSNGNSKLTTFDVSKNLALTDLECNNVNLTTLDVAANTSLLTLRCYGNELTTLDVSKNTALKVLNFYSNQLSAIDVSKNIALDTLSCNSNKLATLDVSKNINLKRLNCSNNKLISLNLKNGNNSNLEITNSISRFNYNPDLFCIQVDNKNYSDANWSMLKDATANYSDNCPPQNILISSEFEDKLIALGIDKDGKNGSVLSTQILNVKSIDISNSGITNLSGIEYFMNLESLICKGNLLSTIDLSKNTALKYLDCSNNLLTALDVSKNTLLVELYCDGAVAITNKTINAKTTSTNRLTVLDLSNNLFLTKLSCSNNQIVNLDLSKNTFLTNINCSNNDLQNLNLNNSNNTKMLTVNFKNNASLFCIKVDNAAYSNTNWAGAKDITTRYSEDCDAPLALPSNNFTIESKGESCLNQNNGEINITAKVNYNYVVNINGTKYPLVNNSLKISNLTPAVYNVSITITGELFEQNFSITIPKGATITAKSTVSSRLAAVEITEGTAPYTVFVNGEEQFETASDTFTVGVNKGDFLEVKTAKACEGIYLKEIDNDILESVLAHPNPTSGKFEIEIPISIKEIVIDLYTMDSKIISKETYTPINGRIPLNLENQASGVYIAKIYLAQPKYLKIIKK